MLFAPPSDLSHAPLFGGGDITSTLSGFSDLFWDLSEDLDVSVRGLSVLLRLYTGVPGKDDLKVNYQDPDYRKIEPTLIALSKREFPFVCPIYGEDEHNGPIAWQVTEEAIEVLFHRLWNRLWSWQP